MVVLGVPAGSAAAAWRIPCVLQESDTAAVSSAAEELESQEAELCLLAVVASAAPFGELDEVGLCFACICNGCVGLSLTSGQARAAGRFGRVCSTSFAFLLLLHAAEGTHEQSSALLGIASLIGAALSLPNAASLCLTASLHPHTAGVAARCSVCVCAQLQMVDKADKPPIMGACTMCCDTLITQLLSCAVLCCCKALRWTPETVLELILKG